MQETINELTQELGRILNFWSKNTLDTEYGGFFGEIDGGLNVNNTASKGAVLNSRILWTFSAAYNFNKNPEYLEMAHRAYNYLIEKFIDKENGGIFWALDHKGNVISNRKQTYAQGFAIYGLSEYYKASGEPASLLHAQNIYKLMETYCHDAQLGGYIEALSSEWGKLDDMRLSEKDANEPKSMNTHLHILEPYTNLYRIWPDEGLAKNIEQLIRIFLGKILDNNTAHLGLFFDYNWDSKSTMVSYGHDIEAAWLLTEAAEALGNHELLEEVERVAVKIADVTMAEGSDTDGSLYYEKEGTHLDTDKHWWPQAEAVVGYLNAYQISKDEKYFQQFLHVWEFIKCHLTDPHSGEWYWRVDRHKKPYSDDVLAGFWKCPYHNSRALIEAIHRLGKI